MEITAKQLDSITLIQANAYLDKQQLIAEEKYSLLSELWNYKSKHATHIKIGKMMDDELAKLKKIKELRKDMELTKGMFG